MNYGWVTPLRIFRIQDWRVKLADELLSHMFFRNLLLVFQNEGRFIEELDHDLEKIVPEFAVCARQPTNEIFSSALWRWFQMRELKPGESFRPFLDVRYQLWMRELRRIVCEVSPNPVLRLAADLQENELNHHLPVIHCRECGMTGWAGTKREQDNAINANLEQFYRYFFNRSPQVYYLFPGGVTPALEDDPSFTRILCGNCLHLSFGDQIAACGGCGESGRLIPVYVKNYRIQSKNGDTTHGSNTCPYCETANSLTVLGSQAASLLSVVISQLYSSPFNTDHVKKLITFSDSVQDASHRAGFFGARTYRFNFRSALQQFLQSAQESNIHLPDLPDAFIRFYRERWTEHEFIARLLPNDMAWREDYEALMETGKLPKESKLLYDLEQRIGWEIYSEYGHNSRVGRTLEKSGCSVAEFDARSIEKAVERCLETIQNEIGGLEKMAGEELAFVMYGLLTSLKSKGGIYHPSLERYITEYGNSYLLTINPHLPGFARSSRTPTFLGTRYSERFDQIVGKTRSWYQDWLQKCLGHRNPKISEYAGDFYSTLIQALVDAKVFLEFESKRDKIWGINPVILCVSLEVEQLRCKDCSHSLSVSGKELSIWVNHPCLRKKCRGSYSPTETELDYYGSLYRNGDICRVFTAEHTGLLERGIRETLEKRFMENDYPWDPNLLSCTPTLEMGIDIGDLSSALLCSVPPNQSSYLQRIGRTGRRDGNSFTMTVANMKPHDLYFYAKPDEMIRGSVQPPGFFLSASAVLERQFTGFCLDRWIESGIGPKDLPDRLGKILNHMNARDREGVFPYTLLHFIENHRSLLFDRFVNAMGELPAESTEKLRNFIEGNEKNDGGLHYRVVSGLEEVNAELQALRKKVKTITKRIKNLEESLVCDSKTKDELEDLKMEKSALNAIARKIVDKDTFNFFTDEGLLPNYAFPEAGIILRSIIWRKKQNVDGAGSYKSFNFEYERPAARAIHELAPTNSFYAGGRKVTIDQIDMNLSTIEEWRFCNTCSHMERTALDSEKDNCPKCGSSLWKDEGRKRKMLRMRQVIATTRDDRSRVADDSDTREPEYFNKAMVVDVDENEVRKAFKIDCEDMPFGFEFLSKAGFREINFGNKNHVGEMIIIAGKEIPKNGFSICVECGKVQGLTRDPNKGNAHALTCRYRSRDDSTKVIDFIYLYREFYSEAIRILLPVSSFAGSIQNLQSFIASILLGLKKLFKGGIDHLQTTIQEQPLPDTPSFRKQFLIIYDLVPGGTGYLKELVLNPEKMFEVFELALNELKACSCRNDPVKDGCYRCLFAYRSSFDIPDISRDAAIGILSDILTQKDNFIETDTVAKIQQNVLIESELEAKFIEALRRMSFHDQRVLLRRDVVNQKPGWYLRIHGKGYTIEPQVNLGDADGVSIAAKPDFIFYPERQETGKPIAVFIDGFRFHADADGKKSKIGEDTAKRMAIIRSGKYIVWSLTWDDVEGGLNNQNDVFEPFLTNDSQRLNRLLSGYDKKIPVKHLSPVKKENSLGIFKHFLVYPERESWQILAFCLALLRFDLKNSVDEKFTDELEQLIREDQDWNGQTLPSKSERGDFKVAVIRQNFVDQDCKFILTASAKTESLETHQFHEMKINARLFDLNSTGRKEEFKRAWVGFLRLFNLMQFLPQNYFVTSQGLKDAEYSRLEFQNAENLPASNWKDPEASEILEMAAPSVHSLLHRIIKDRKRLPDAGFELVDDSGQVIATAELGWEDEKVALLLPEEQLFEHLFITHGWTAVVLEENDSHIDKIIAALGPVKKRM